MRFFEAPDGLVFDATAVGFGLCNGDKPAGENGVEGVGDVVVGFGDVVFTEAGDAIDGAHINELAGAIQHEHVRGGFGTECLADEAGGIRHFKGALKAHALDVGGGGFGVEVALLARGAAVDSYPGNATGDGAGLQFLHIAAVIVLLHEGAAGVGPLQYHRFAAELRHGVNLAELVGKSEAGGDGGAEFVGGFLRKSGGGEAKGGKDDEEQALHGDSPYF